jgi:hypothetical protein
VREQVGHIHGEGKNQLEFGHKLLMLLHLGDHVTYLFVSHVLDIALE